MKIDGIYIAGLERSSRSSFILATVIAANAVCLPVSSPVSNEEATLTATQVACVFVSEVTDAEILARGCKITEKLLPVLLPLLQKLVIERDAAKRTGIRWSDEDAGP